MSKGREAEYDGHGKMILVVDDDESVLQTVATMLESLNYRTLCASSSIQALLIAQTYANITAAFLDLSMEPTSGERLALELREHRSNLPIIYITGRDAEIYTPNPPGDVLQKPVSRKTILTALCKVLPVLCLALVLTGCAPMAPHKLVKELAKDRAIVTGTATTIYGSVRFTRIGETTNSVTVSPDGTITINHK